MNVSFTANKRTNLQQTIKNKQQLYKRFNRRFYATHNPGECTFLRREMNLVVKELKQFATQWKKAGFGSTSWITTGFAAKTLTGSGKWGNAGGKSGSRNTGSKSKSRTSKSTAAKSGKSKSAATSRRSPSKTTRRTTTPWSSKSRTSGFAKTQRKSFAFAR